ncbi:cytidine triphosphate synthase, putative [Trypanosoma equiperdum]|uniref:CTP synthase n=2 Tax=Trypanozoon TaxID=39700 RepID=Q4GZ95_TRYB2|nr:cytidine triphosphate synthase, putative [Trypanosoma brucei brucei TREU927]CAJ16071.1 cytidine triphosphate synthase, putative [Trypanosoma brucei brucei TREU927]SCU73074.1 cytidine triphosphate synthase, putative [Trypanosoma equiperdum]
MEGSATAKAYMLPSPELRPVSGTGACKYIVVTGGVCSSLGKGVTTSATGALLRAEGYQVCSIKIDPYINMDAGLMSPYEHGEVYVLDDGGEVDLDLGNYERWMSVQLRREHNITTGKVYQKLINKERQGGFLGKTVQLVPHFTNDVVESIFRVSQSPVDESGAQPEICMIELGGTVGDMESQPFVEALRRLRCLVGPDEFCLMHTTYLPVFGGSQKTKPTQHSTRTLLSMGLQPDILICRSENRLTPDAKEKLSNLCGVRSGDIVSAPNVSCLYEVPVVFTKDGLVDRLVEKLRLVKRTPATDVPRIDTYKTYVKILRNMSNPTVRIAFVGKYLQDAGDTYFSVLQCFEHCQIALQVRLDILYVDSEELEGPNADEARKALLGCDGIFVPGGFGNRGVDGKCAAAQVARMNNIPYFGVCLGMQVAVIELSRNVVGWSDANSEEFNKESTHQVVRIMDCDRNKMGANMHLGACDVHIVEKSSIMAKIYSKSNIVVERHRHRYEVNTAYFEDLRKAGLCISAVTDPTFSSRCRVEAVENPSLRFFLAVQFHPEFISTPMDPAPTYLSFMAAAAKKDYVWPQKCSQRRLKQA